MFRVSILLILAGLAGCSPSDRDSPKRGSFSFDGRSLSYLCVGHGQPTLILEAPSGISNEEAFANVIPDLAARHRVCAYERAAYGSSDPLEPGEIQSVSDYAAELAAFLELVGTDSPLVIVGFSYGGFVARYFAGHRPERVAGLVLIDSPHVRWLRTMKDEMTPDDWQKVEDIMQWFLDNRGHDVWTSQFEVESAPPLPPAMPVVVVTRALDHERMRLSGVSEDGFRIYNDVHFRLAPEHARLSGNTVAVTAANSDHMIPDAEPEVILGAIGTLLEMIE